MSSSLRNCASCSSKCANDDSVGWEIGTIGRDTVNVPKLYGVDLESLALIVAQLYHCPLMVDPWCSKRRHGPGPQHPLG
ncbi:hypothetical protein Pla100_26410 [Neorhodopirellula pilleata]|uniref:Uncharacterized protein n=1 Tax=Neorhodopirellula pilleata TaxID=2714738 RepID=A0A5C6ADK5_9BACT|nr:hypothetical protein Pla100_26410 [Neorhodopirellula pilleata]